MLKESCEIIKKPPPDLNFLKMKMPLVFLWVLPDSLKFMISLQISVYMIFEIRRRVDRTVSVTSCAWTSCIRPQFCSLRSTIPAQDLSLISLDVQVQGGKSWQTNAFIVFFPFLIPISVTSSKRLSNSGHRGTVVSGDGE